MAEPNEREPKQGEPNHEEASAPAPGVPVAADVSPFARLAAQVALMEPSVSMCGDLDRLDDLEPDELIRLLRHTAVAKRALDAIEARALNIVEHRGATVTRRGHRTRRWWANELGMSHAQASHRVRVATRIHEHYPKIAAALEAGHLSFDCAAALVRRESERTRDGFVELQEHLVRLAIFEPFERFEQAVEAIALRLDPDGPKPDDPRLNRLRITNEFGNTRITALYDPVNAEVVLNAIRRAVDAERSAAETPTRHDPPSENSVRKEPQVETQARNEPASETATGHASAGAADGRSIDEADGGGCSGALTSVGPDKAGREVQAEGVEADSYLGSGAVGAPDLGSSQGAASDTIGRSDAVDPSAVPGFGVVADSGNERRLGHDCLDDFDTESIQSESAEILDAGQVSTEYDRPKPQLTTEDVHRLGALPEEPGDSIARLQGQAFLRICERAIAACDRPGRPPTAHIDLIMREGDVGFASTRTTGGLAHGNHLGELMCSAVYRLVKTDRTGTPLNVGRAQRLATADQRRAAFLRDGGCVFPGCAAPATATDLHHVDRWQDGGATDLDNLACLCRFHHSVTHSAGWQMTAHHPTPTEPHRFEWVTPVGDTLRSMHHPSAAPIPAPRPRAG